MFVRPIGNPTEVLSHPCQQVTSSFLGIPWDWVIRREFSKLETQGECSYLAAGEGGDNLLEQLENLLRILDVLFLLHPIRCRVDIDPQVPQEGERADQAREIRRAVLSSREMWGKKAKV